MYERKLIEMGAKITYYRRIKEKKQIDLATEIGISESYLSKIERGRCLRGISINIIFALADKLEVDVMDILGPFK